MSSLKGRTVSFYLHTQVDEVADGEIISDIYVIANEAYVVIEHNNKWHQRPLGAIWISTDHTVIGESIGVMSI